MDWPARTIFEDFGFVNMNKEKIFRTLKILA